MATLSRMMKKAASSLIPLANRSTLRHRNFTSAIIFTTPLKTSSTITNNSTINLTRTTSIPAHHHFASLAKKRSESDEALLSILEDEIICAEDEIQELEVAEKPTEFPFKIVDEEGMAILKLTRDYKDEAIKVTVCMPEDSDDVPAEGEEETDLRYVDMVVSVSKKNNNGPILEFTVLAESDGITINSFVIKNPNVSDEDMAYGGPEFEDLDEQLQEALRTFLEVRGIEPSMTGFLHDYLMNKEVKEYTGWLKNLKKFVAN